MVPIYSLVAFLSIWFYKNSVYYSVIGDCYEAFTIAAFFALLCHYIAPDLHTQKDYFRGIKPKPWIWPVTWMKKCCGGEHGMWRTPRSGLTWFNVCRATTCSVFWLMCLVDLDWRLPVLPAAGGYDDYRRCLAVVQSVLRGEPEPGFYSCLGMFPRWSCLLSRWSCIYTNNSGLGY